MNSKHRYQVQLPAPAAIQDPRTDVRHQAATPIRPPMLWRRWIVAFITGEIVGFGIAAAIGGIFASRIDRLGGPFGIIILAMVAGVAEGAVVGWTQWRVLRDLLPNLGASAWIVATAAGGATAWGIGMSLGTLAAPTTSPGPFTLLLAAALLGALVGFVFGMVQWSVLRRHRPRASLWIAANSVGWTLGMVVAFGGVGIVPTGAPVAVFIAVGAVTGALMAILPAAATGWTLVHWFGDQAARVDTPETPLVDRMMPRTRVSTPIGSHNEGQRSN